MLIFSLSWFNEEKRFPRPQFFFFFFFLSLCELCSCRSRILFDLLTFLLPRNARARFYAHAQTHTHQTRFVSSSWQKHRDKEKVIEDPFDRERVRAYKERERERGLFSGKNTRTLKKKKRKSDDQKKTRKERGKEEEEDHR